MIPYNAFASNNGFTLYSGGLVAPKTGYYLISARVSGYGTNGWLRAHVAASTSVTTNASIVASAILRMPSGSYHSVVIDPTIVYVQQGQVIYARQNDGSGFDLNSGMDSGIMGTVITAVFIGD